MKTFWLNFHLAYACRHSGACCSSGWPIPVERDRVIPIRALTGRAGDSWLIPAEAAPADVAGTLALGANGHCVFHGSGCGIHAARPASCSHFPYVCLIDPRGVHVTLSHYCPTAASLLFANHGPIAIIEGPPPVPGLAIPEGLDARESLPPAFAESSMTAAATAGKLRTAKLRLMSWDDLSEWEQSAVAAPWTGGGNPSSRLELFDLARHAVPAPLVWPAAPADLDRVWKELIEPSWSDFAAVLARYRAAKAFASWALYLDDGIAAVRRSIDQAVVVLQVETARQCAASGAALDAARLKAAIRSADLLLVHYVDR